MTRVTPMMPKIPNLKDGVSFQQKTITIRSDQAEYLRQQSISLSRFVQQKLDELMNEGKAKK